jgi:hypothetical protein
MGLIDFKVPTLFILPHVLFGVLTSKMKSISPVVRHFMVPFFFFFFNFFVVLGLELRVYTLSHSTNSLFMKRFFF